LSLSELAAQRDKEEIKRTVQHIKSMQAVTAAQVRALDMRARIHLVLDWFDVL
jgi:hypothetical protein